jgi:hypothetical protein
MQQIPAPKGKPVLAEPGLALEEGLEVTPE